MSENQILGMILGLHAGDCLGAANEFLPASAKWNSITEITGGGKFNWKVGEATDDTDLTLCVLKSIESSDKINFDILKSEFLKWFASNPPDIGTTTVKGLENLKADLPLRDCGHINIEFQGNGSLMRAAPLALLNENAIASYHREIIHFNLSEILVTQTKMTHGHQNCVDCDLIFIFLLQKILRNPFLSKFEAIKQTLQYAQCVNPKICSQLSLTLPMEWDQVPSSGFCVDTLGAAIWALANRDNFEDSVIAAVNRGDDSDSCGAVTGALCGAYYGREESYLNVIPTRWLETLELREDLSKEIRRLKGALHGK